MNDACNPATSSILKPASNKRLVFFYANHGIADPLPNLLLTL